MMKIAYFGYDSVISCLYKLLEQGHDVQVILTGADSAENEKIRACAKQKKIPVIKTRPDETTMESLIEQGVEWFFSAEYPWKIPTTDKVKYAINLHPTLLPFGKGKTPLPSLLLQHPEYAGLSFHKMSEKFDAGDIILQQPITLENDETYDTLCARIYLTADRLMEQLLANLNTLYDNAKPQNDGDTFLAISEKDRTINWSRPTATILHQVRAFGSLGTFVKLQQQKLVTSQASGFVQSHRFEPGTVIQDNFHSVTVATQDGFLTILKNTLSH